MSAVFSVALPIIVIILNRLFGDLFFSLSLSLCHSLTWQLCGFVSLSADFYLRQRRKINKRSQKQSQTHNRIALLVVHWTFYSLITIITFALGLAFRCHSLCVSVCSCFTFSVSYFLYSTPSPFTVCCRLLWVLFYSCFATLFRFLTHHKTISTTIKTATTLRNVTHENIGICRLTVRIWLREQIKHTLGECFVNAYIHTRTPRDRHAHSKLKREGEWERERETLTQSHASMPLAYNETNIAVAAKKKMYSHTAATSVVITWLWLHTVLVQWCWALIAVEQPHENSKLYRCSHIPFSFKFRWTVSTFYFSKGEERK